MGCAVAAFATAAVAEGPVDSALMEALAKAKRLHDEIESRHGGWVQTANGRMHYLHWPRPAGVPLVWAHGTWGSAFDLAPYADALGDAGYSVVAIDWFAHGKTPIPTKEVSVGHVADDIAALMSSLGMERAVVGGHSRGGTIAAAFYRSYPQRTRGLVLSDGGSFSWQGVYDRLGDAELEKRVAQIPDYVEQRYSSLAEAFADVGRRRPRTEESLASWSLRVMGRLSEREGAWYYNYGITPWLKEDSARATVEVVRRSSGVTLFQASTFHAVPREIFRSLHVPMLIIDPVSDPDPFAATDENQALARMHPGLVVHRVYENTGHGAGFERPARFMADLKEFASRLREQPAR